MSKAAKITLSLLITVLIIMIASIAYITKKNEQYRLASDKCWAYIDNGLYDKAVEYINLAGNKENQLIYDCLGEAYYNLGNLQLALYNFKKAEELQDNIFTAYYSPSLNIHIYSRIAEIMHQKGYYDDAIRYYHKALKEMMNNRKVRARYKADYVNMLREIAEIYDEKGDKEKAKEYYDKADRLANKFKLIKD